MLEISDNLHGQSCQCLSWSVMVKFHCDVLVSKVLISYHHCYSLLPKHTCQRKIIFTSASVIHSYELWSLLVSCGVQETSNRKYNTEKDNAMPDKNKTVEAGDSRKLKQVRNKRQDIL